MSKHTWVLAVPLLVCIGCSKGPKQRLRGKWVGERIDNVSAEQIVKTTAWVKGFSMDFGPDKVKVSVPGAEPRSGAYEVARNNGSKVVVAVAGPDGRKDEAKLALADDGKSLHWDIGDAREIVLMRAP